MRVCIATFCLVAVLYADQFDTLYSVESARMRVELAAYAKWSGKRALKGSRDRAYAALLIFEPDHKRARRTLKYRWNKKTGSWLRPGAYTRPEDKPGPVLEEATARWRDLTELHAHNVFKALEGVQGPRRARAIDELLRVAPDNFAAHKEHGELRVGDKWVLIETTTAPERRAEIEQAAKQALARAPKPRAVDLNGEDRKFGVAFPGAWKGRTWRGMGNVPQEEVKRTLRVADATRPLFDAVFGGRSRTGVELTFYLLKGGKGAGKQALRKHPAYGDAERRFVQGLSGSWVPESFGFITWGENSARRTDIVARQATGMYLRSRFGITATQGWLYEGIGLYFTYLLTGTRLTTSAKRTGYQQDPLAHEQQKRGVEFAKADWVELARRLFQQERPPDLRLIVAKDVNTLTANDLLVCYAMTSYLLECRPEETVNFLAAYGKGDNLDDALAAYLDVDLAGFEKRLRRWMEERS